MTGERGMTFSPARAFRTLQRRKRRRSFSLLRYVDNATAPDRLREFLLQTYQVHEQQLKDEATIG